MGTITGLPVYANTIATPSLSNINIESDVHVKGNVFANGRLDTAGTMYATFRLGSNVPFDTTPELVPSSTLTLPYDPQAGDLSTMLTMNLVLPNPNDFNDFTAGYITLPASGLYSIHIQGSFINDPNKTDVKNGVYMRFLNHPRPTARVGVAYSANDIVSTCYVGYLLAGDKLQPTFFSNDPLAQLNAAAGETYVSFTVATTLTPNPGSFVRLEE